MYYLKLKKQKHAAKIQKGELLMVQLENDYYIHTDSRCYRLLKDTKKKNKDGKETYKVIGYYSKIEDVLQAYINENLKKSIQDHDMNVSELLKEIEELRNEVHEMFASMPETEKAKEADVKEIDDENDEDDAPIDIDPLGDSTISLS